MEVTEKAATPIKGKQPFLRSVTKVLANFKFSLFFNREDPKNIQRAAARMQRAARNFCYIVFLLAHLLNGNLNQPITGRPRYPALIPILFSEKAGEEANSRKRPRKLHRSLEARQRRAAKNKEKWNKKKDARKSGGIQPVPEPTGACTPVTNNNSKY